MVREEYVTWKNGAFTGEGLWAQSESKKGVVICHPHPQMGGSMYNNVVEALRDVFSSEGLSALRFNFRGVGGSTGSYDEGIGEQQDVLSACNFLKRQGVDEIVLAGYSFGAWVGSDVLRNHSPAFRGAFLVSPPDKFFHFNWSGLKNVVDMIICGRIDPFCDIGNLKKISDEIQAKFIVMEEADHFYAGYESQLIECLRTYIKVK